MMPAVLTFDNIPLNDLETLKFLARGENLQGVFQLASYKTAKYMKEDLPLLVKKAIIEGVSEVEVVGKVSDINTIIRPSSENSGSTARYNKKSQGLLAPIPIKPQNKFYKVFCENTKETYNELIYQEQLMFLLDKVFRLDDLGKADIYRRYFENCQDDKISELKTIYWNLYKGEATVQELKEFWEFLLTVAGYSFNKSHSVSYAVLSLKTAYLKVHLSRYYIATCIGKCTSDQKEDKMEKIEKLVEDARSMGIQVKLARINNSFEKPTPDIDEEIIYLSCDIAKGIGERVAKALSTKNDFTSITEFLNWADKQITYNKDKEGNPTTSKVFDKGTYLLLVKMGFFEPIEPDMNVAIATINNHTINVKEAREKKFIKKDNGYVYKLKDNATFKEELLEDYDQTCYVMCKYAFLKDKLPQLDGSKLKYEKELLDFFLSDPFEKFGDKFKKVTRGEEWINGEALICVKKVSCGKKGSYIYTSVEGIWNIPDMPKRCYISNEHINYKFGDIIYVKWSENVETNRLKINHHEIYGKLDL